MNYQTGQRSPDEWEEVETHYHGTISANEIDFIVTYESGHAEFTAKKIIDLTERTPTDTDPDKADEYALVYTLPGHTGGVRSLSFGPDNSLLATGGIELASGGASDGKGRGITAPNPIGQQKAIERAWKNAGLSPATASYVEGHGTSTRVHSVLDEIHNIRPN